MRRQLKLYAQRQLASALTHEISGEVEFAHLATLKVLVRAALVRRPAPPPPLPPPSPDLLPRGRPTVHRAGIGRGR